MKENSLCTKNTDIVCPQSRQPSPSQPAASGLQNPPRVPGWAYWGQQLAGTALLQPAPPPAVGIAGGWRRAPFVLPPLQLQRWDQVPPTYTLISPHSGLTHSLPAPTFGVKPRSDLSCCDAKAQIQPPGMGHSVPMPGSHLSPHYQSFLPKNHNLQPFQMFCWLSVRAGDRSEGSRIRTEGRAEPRAKAALGCSKARSCSSLPRTLDPSGKQEQV